MTSSVSGEAIEAAARVLIGEGLSPEAATRAATAALEAAMPHVASGTAVSLRYMDEIEASEVANAWIDDIAVRGEGPGRRIEHMRFERQDGGAILYWSRNRVSAYAMIVRDGLNYSVLLRDLDLIDN